MKKLSFTWKLFLVISYIELIAFGLFQLFVIAIFIAGNNSSSKDYQFFLSFTAGLLPICLNYFFNVYALHRHYPDKRISKTLKGWMIAIGVLNILLWIVLLLLCIELINQQSSSQQDNKGGIIIIVILSLLWIAGLYSLFFQFRLFAFLKRNSRRELTTLIHSIGT